MAGPDDSENRASTQHRPAAGALRRLRKAGVMSTQETVMETKTPTRSPHFVPTPERIAQLDRLRDEIAELSAYLEAVASRLLDLIREFDARGGWGNGSRLVRGMAELAGRTRHGRRPREGPRGTLPGDPAAPGRGAGPRGTLVRQGAGPDAGGDAGAEERLLNVGRAGTAAHVERIVRAWQRVDRKAAAREAARQRESRALHVYTDDDGTVVLRGRLTPEVGALLQRTLAAAPRRCTSGPEERRRPPTRAPRRRLDASRATAQRGRSSRRMRWRCWQRRPCTRSSIPERPARGSRWWCTSTRPCSRTQNSPARPSSNEGGARFRGNVAAPCVRCESRGDAPR